MSLLLLTLMPVLIGLLLGVIANMVILNLSLEYYDMDKRWDFIHREFYIVQGALEGILNGAIFGFIYTIYVVWKNHSSLGKRFFRSVFNRVIVIVLFCWFVGGALASLLLYQFPEVAPYPMPYITFESTYAFKRCGWVVGSIWGGMIGGVLALGWAIYTTSRQGKKLKTL